MKTPEHIAPVWYYTPFYAMLRAATYPLLGIDAKFWGFVVMAGAIALPAVLPWLDRSPVKSMRYKGCDIESDAGVFIVSFFILGYLGTIPPSTVCDVLAQVCTVLVLRLLRADAVVHARRTHQARAGTGDDAMKQSTRVRSSGVVFRQEKTSTSWHPASKDLADATGRSKTMNYVKTNDGVEIFFKDWGPKNAQPIVFHHGWPLSSDDWDTQMLFFFEQRLSGHRDRQTRTWAIRSGVGRT